jgi:fluoroacetyl-CoA thioesterase
MTFAVTDGDTAEALGSGDLPVLATPCLLAWCEAATCEAARSVLQPGQTTVGSRIELRHLRPTPLGGTVSVHATPLGADGRVLRFEVGATDARGTTIATGEVTRAVVDAERFLARCNADRNR